MDKVQEANNNETQEGSDQYIWIAGAFIGGFLLLMIIIIIAILLWRHVKMQNTSAHQNWAGPSPLADGNIPEEGNCSIFGRSMSLSGLSTSPILSNEPQRVQEVHDMDAKNIHENFEEGENEKTFTTISAINIPTVPATPTKTESSATKAPMSTQIAENGLSDDTFPPPPLDLPEEFPMPPLPEAFHEQALKDGHQQPFPHMESYQQGEKGTQDALNLHISNTDALQITNNFQDQLLPPPPPDF